MPFKADHPLLAKLITRFPDAAKITEALGEVTITADRKQILEIARFLRDDLKFEMLSDVTGVDYLTVQKLEAPERYAVVYHLYHLGEKDWIRVKAWVPEGGDDASEGPALESLVPLYGSANWFEREVWDLYGIRFRHHPDLRRIMMAEDYEGFPLRKDFPMRGH